MNPICNKSKGFTLIELLVVIAIIAILAVIIMVNVGSARNKAKDTAVMGNMNSLPTAATMYVIDNNTDYTNICTESNFQKITNAVIKNGGILYCKSSSTKWVTCSPLATSTNIFWCIDDTGAKMKINNNCNDYTDPSLYYCHNI